MSLTLLKYFKGSAEPIPQSPQIPLVPQNRSELHRPLLFTSVLEDNIVPTKEEFSALKELDMRLHTLKFGQEIAKKYSSLNRPDGKVMSLNRYMILLHKTITNFKSF